MEFVHFESLNPDGSRDCKSIPGNEIYIVRPLTVLEAEFAEKLRIGFFGNAPFRPRSTYEMMKWSTGTAEGREFAAACAMQIDVPHESVQAVLVTKSGARYFLGEAAYEHELPHLGIAAQRCQPK